MEMCGQFQAPASSPFVEEPCLHIEGWADPRVSLNIAEERIIAHTEIRKPIRLSSGL